MKMESLLKIHFILIIFLGEREYLIGQDVYSAADVMMFSSNELIYFHVVEPSKIGYVFKVRPARDFGDSFHTLYNRVHLVPVQPALACKEIENSQLISGSFALVERGDCPFVTKAKHAENAGAIGVLIADNDFSNDEITVNMIGDDSVTQVSIPAGLMLAEDSKHIKEALKTEGRNSAVIKIPVNVTNSPELFIKQPPWSYW
ncbi:protease-associated domain-containing protein 1-like [Xenia sp. Carnegie-2017]|uniref:protease-associated domain-containing protein 1-like n=1 Tax=Xenia sp. Carnegie-2017 TaxID=2897299 RepID=UPI001F0482F4|nr:protease-associated domain-containing protein 1-like [Xenia sp. Carnegie-2017]